MIARDAFMLVLLTCLAIVPSVQAQASGITSILGLKYPSQATLQNGVAQVTVTFSVYYNYYHNPQGYLVFGIADQSASEYVEGTATATPVPCQPLTETKYANAALCAVVPGSSSGSESASFILTFNSPGQYSLSVLTFVLDSKNLLSGNVVTGSTNGRNFEITVTGQVQTSTSSATTPVTTSVQTSTTDTSPLGYTTPVTTSGQTTSTAMTSQTSPLDSTLLYVIAGLIAVVIVLSILVMRKRRVAPSQPSQSASPAITGSPDAARPPLSKGAKYCVHCGAVIPSVVTFCTKCGKKQ